MVKKIYPFAPIHKEVILNYLKYKINILQGAVRSGKTHLSNMLFLKYLFGKQGKVVLSGFSANTIKKNVVTDIEEILGIEIKFRNNSKGEYFEIPYKGYEGLTFYVVGGGREGDERKVQGMTVLFWYADEAATYAKSFFEMMLTRLSRDDSKAIFTLNPEGPAHYLKRFIDSQTDKDNKNYIPFFVKAYRFILDDNYSLPEDYKLQQKNTYSGHMYRRLILGEWAAGEGLVYSVDKIKKIKSDEFQEIYNNAIECRKYGSDGEYSEKHNIGVDLGTVHPTSFIKAWKYKGIWYIVDEYYESKVAPSDLPKNLKEFNDKHKKNQFENNNIYYDHAAAWFFQQAKQDYPSLQLNTAKKEVLKGIVFIENLILNGKLVIVEDKCKNLLNEINTYSWDPKSNKDDVIKLNDDALDALRYAIYSSEYQSSYY